jgi:signal transduction histidine kinase
VLSKLRWGAFGLRGRIVGAVVVTTAVTLGVAGLVLLPRLEGSLQNASKATLRKDVKEAFKRGGALSTLAQIPYTDIAILGVPGVDKHSPAYLKAARTNNLLIRTEDRLRLQLGTEGLLLIGYVDQTGHGQPIIPYGLPGADSGAAISAATNESLVGSLDDVQAAHRRLDTYYSFGNVHGNQAVRAAIWLPGVATPSPSLYGTPPAILVVRKSLDEIPGAVDAVRRALAIAVIAGLALTFLIAIPLAATLVRRLHRLRQGALELAIDGLAGGGADLPVDRARDEVGDLARSFATMQRRLRQQEEARRQFVATASHELRTPLASLDGMLELLADDLSEPNPDLEDANDLLERARAQSRRLGRLAADLLDLSRLDADVALRSEPVELAELGRAVLAEFDLASRERGVDLTLDERGPVWALADPGSVARILRILVDNALRVAPRDSAVRVELSDSAVPTLIVADRGPGIAPEERALIFQRFKRGRETGGEAGFGLGLAIGRELAQRMGGSLELVDRPAPGATFKLTLPSAPAQVPEPVQSPAAV